MKPVNQFTQVYVPEHSCPSCAYKMDAVTAVSGETRKPEENDVSICMKCGTIIVFNKDLSFRLPTEEDQKRIEDLDTYDKLVSVQKLIRMSNLQRDLQPPHVWNSELSADWLLDAHLVILS